MPCFFKNNRDMIYVFMGVCGCGKTTIGMEFARRMGIQFFDADDFYPNENIVKMSKGYPLTDEDRVGWLKTLGESIGKWSLDGSVVLACSALKRSHRETLELKGRNKVVYVFLDGATELLKQRISNRVDHFMKEEMLSGQLDELERPENALRVEIDRPVADVVSFIVKELYR